MRVLVVRAPGRESLPEGTQPFEPLLTGTDTGGILPTSSDDTAVLLYPSTTSDPKGAELTHFRLFMNCMTAGGLFGAGADDVTMAVLPLFHVFGLSSVLNVTVRYAGSMSLVPRFEAGAVIDALERDGVTNFLGVPTMFFAMLQENISSRDLSRFRIAVSGGAAVPGESSARSRTSTAW